MSRFWITFSERWDRQQEKREKKDKAEKEIRKKIRVALREQAKALDERIKKVRDERDPIPPPHNPKDLGWWLEDILKCMEEVRDLVTYLLEREDELDDHK